MALASVDDVTGLGVASLKGSKIIGFMEKPTKENAPSNLINAGMIILEPKVLNIHDQKVISTEKEVYPKSLRLEKCMAIRFSASGMIPVHTTRTKKRSRVGRDTERGSKLLASSIEY